MSKNSDHCPGDAKKKHRSSRLQSDSPNAAAKPFVSNQKQKQAETIPPAERTKLVAMFNAGHYIELENRTAILAKKYPNSGFIWKVLSVSLLMQGKDALSALKKATILLPQDAEAHNNLGVALRDRGQLNDALESFRRALAQNPRYADAYNNRGITLQDIGQLDDAVGSFRQALEIKPEYAEAHNNLGNALQLLGQLDDAIVHLQKALILDPHYAKAHNNLGNALQRLGRDEEAAASYHRALEILPNYAEALCNLCNVALTAGKTDEAINFGRRAIEINPNYAEAHNNLGNALQEVGLLDSAVKSFRRALEINPNFSEAHNNLGSVLRELQQLDVAEASCRRALEIKRNFAEAHVNLAMVLRNQGRTAEAESNCLGALKINPNLTGAILFLAELQTDQGQFSEAENAYRRAISIDAESPEAWAGIAQLRKMTHSDADWLAEAKRIADKSLPPRKEVYLRYSLGKYFDDVKDFDQAFFNYRRANELTKGYGTQYDQHQQTLSVDLSIRHYDRDWVTRIRTNSSASTRPVLIVGMPRSGTSLAEQILASHPAAFGAGELGFWHTAAQREPSAHMSESSESLLRNMSNEYLKLLDEFSVDAARVVDKMPGNFMYLGLVHAAFPNARIIHMQRHPIDICLSIYFQHLNTAHSYANDLDNIAHYYNEYIRMMEHWSSTLPQNAILHVPYEKLVADQEGWTRKMLEFVDLPWNERCLEFHQSARTVSTLSNWQVRQKINSASVERWRNYQKFVGPLLHLTAQDSVISHAAHRHETTTKIGG